VADPSLDAAAPDNAADYFEDGRRRALALGNRGPVRLDANGRLAQDILDAYHRAGFYVFTGVLSPAEVAELSAEFDQVLENAPVAVDNRVDRHGRASAFADYYTLGVAFDDPHGPAAVGMVSHPLLMMGSALRLSGHPMILKMAEGVHGPDFVPFHESIFHKAAGNGLPTGWHQDGRTHWTETGESLEGPDGAGPSHGFNLSVSWTHCTPANCLWVVPGSHDRWRLAGGGKFPPISQRLPDAVPMLLDPGDCGMVNRSTLHGSYPNRSDERRVTMVIGFHKRASAIGAQVTNVHAFKRPGGAGVRVTYSEDYVLRRTRMIPLAIDARRQHYPGETPYVYQGSYIGEGAWNERTRAEIGREGEEYWRQDITL
jgi:hypothetical protein